jgi:Co/Zn/Cd efflux system component
VTHLRSADGTILCDHAEAHPEGVSLSTVVDEHEHGHEYGHEHGLIDRSILRSRAGIRAVSWSRSLAILTITALAQAFIYSRTLSVALLADLIHNFGDALTAILWVPIIRFARLDAPRSD